MAEAQLEKTTIDLNNGKVDFVAQGEVLKFEGFLKVYNESKDEEDEEEKVDGLLQYILQGDG